MKKISAVLIAASMSVLPIVGFTACGQKKLKGTPISSAQEFLDCKDDVVSLKNDIDFGEVDFTWLGDPKIVLGNNHKISNIELDLTNSSSSRLFKIGSKDLVLENISVETKSDKFGFFGGFVAAQQKGGLFNMPEYFYNYTMENIHIKDCTINITMPLKEECYVGGLFGCSSSAVEKESGISIKNCSADGLKINAVSRTANSVWDIANPIYVGGLVGRGTSVTMENCSVNNCEIYAKSGGLDDEIRMGGIIGYLDKNSELSHCYVKDSLVSVSSGAYSGPDIVGGYITQFTRIGGIAGSSTSDTKISGCYSDGNTIKSHCSGGSYAGGIIGVASCDVSNSYAVNNEISCTGRKKEDNRVANLKVGGIAGLTNEVEIKSCFALDNIVDIGLKKIDADYFNFAGYKKSDCKDFLNIFSEYYLEDKETASDWLDRIKSEYSIDEEVFTAFREKVYELNISNQKDLKTLLDKYYKTASDAYDKFDNIEVGGLIGEAGEKTVINSCAAQVEGTNCHYDSFCKNNIGLNMADYNCYILSSNGGANLNKCAELNVGDVYGTSLKEKLGLTDELWVISDDGLPTLNIA